MILTEGNVMNELAHRNKLIDLARVIRSKNSGPFTLTLDIIFKTKDDYLQIKNSGQITPEFIATLYGTEPEFITKILFFDPANAVKIVMPRLIVSGSPGDNDVYGAQQHAPLLEAYLTFKNPHRS